MLSLILGLIPWRCRALPAAGTPSAEQQIASLRQQLRAERAERVAGAIRERELRRELDAARGELEAAHAEIAADRAELAVARGEREQMRIITEGRHPECVIVTRAHLAFLRSQDIRASRAIERLVGALNALELIADGCDRPQKTAVQALNNYRSAEMRG